MARTKRKPLPRMPKGFGMGPEFDDPFVFDWTRKDKAAKKRPVREFREDIRWGEESKRVIKKERVRRKRREWKREIAEEVAEDMAA